MGYELHVTRREHWADTEAPDILMDEWLTYVNSDPELELTNGYDLKMGAETSYQDSPGFCGWNAHPTEKEANSRPWFAFWKGSIETKNPDAPTIRKMMKVASALGAHVQGDDGEIYTEDYLLQMENAEQKRSATNRTVIKPWWKFW
jgi:hypothetical protein